MHPLSPPQSDSLILIPHCDPLSSLSTHLRVPVCLSLDVLIRDNYVRPDGRLVITALAMLYSHSA